MEVDYARLFVLGEGSTPDAVRVKAEDDISDPYALTRGEVNPAEPLRFRWVEGSRPYDLIGTTWAVLDIVSERFVAVLRDAGFSGWSIYPVDLRDGDGTALRGYHGLAATG